MINKTHRFHGLRSLNFVYRNGQVSRGPMFAVKAVHNPRRQSYRAAVVVSRKVHKSAVARNRMRRQLYAALRTSEPNMNMTYDIVITVFNDSVLQASASELTGQLKKQLKEVGAISQKTRAKE